MNTLYSAYGSNMNAGQMAQRCPGAEAIGVATLPGYRFIINNHGYATVRSDADAETPGVLWRLGPNHESALDRHEGYEKGLYDKCSRTVRDAAGSTVQALVYIDHGNRSVDAPKADYLERVIDGAIEHGLPAEYLAMLRAWPRKRGFKAFNRLINELDREDTARWLIERRDTLVLEALDVVRGEKGARPFAETLRDVVTDKAEESADEYPDNSLVLEAGELALQHASLLRFIRHVESLQHEERLLGVLREPNRHGCIGTEGIIITDDPHRPRAPDDRFIVTKHAPALGALWRSIFIFNGEYDVHPRTCRFPDAFAAVAENDAEECDARTVLVRVLEQVRELATARAAEVRTTLDGLREED